MNDKFSAFVEFVLCGLVTMVFIVNAILALIFRDFFVAGLCAILVVISGYNALKSVRRYFDLSQEDDNPETNDVEE